MTFICDSPIDEECALEEILTGVYKVLPSKVTDEKYLSFFVRRPSGNLLFPCFSNSSTIHASFNQIDAMGGLKCQLLGDSHFKTPHCDEVAERFGAPLYCSEPEAPDVTKRLKHVRVFPFERHALEPGVEAIPTPGHRPGGVCYLVDVGGQRCLFVGDAIWHDGSDWKAFPTKPGRPRMIESLGYLAAVDFDVLLANTKINNPHCSIELDERSRRALIESIITKL